MNIRNLKLILLLFMVVCAIMVNKSITFADETSTVKDVEYDIAGPISGNTYKYKIDTDCIKYHVKANGYDKKIGDSCQNNFIAFDNKVTVAESKTDGYGQYTFKLTSLKGFIEYCYNKNPSKTNEASTIPNEKEEDSCTYAKLVNLALSTLSAKAKTFMTFFWNTMFGLNEVFKGYQDSYFFKENTYKAIEKIKSTLHASNLSYGNLKNGSNNDENTSTMEYLTLLTTYMYSINREEKLKSIGRGDLVPFLYYAENADVYDAKEIAKYAYVALIEEFLRVSGKNYWQDEYEQVFKDAYPNIELEEDLETLEEWYDECYAKYKNDRGLKQNPLLGSDIETIIGSNYSISYQVDATEMYIENFFSELGIDADFKENMARNELMARYMMENSYINDTIKDYSVEVSFISENLQRGTFEEKNSCTAVLSDFQTVTFDSEISKIGARDLDGDGVNNKTELGSVKWVDITEFFNKAYQDRKNNGLTTLSYEEEIKKVVDANGEYTDLNDNKVNGHIKYEGGKVLYRTYDYKSNPALRDTDFDGIDDNYDNKPLSGNFSGQTDVERGQKLSVGYTQDYRYFFIDNDKYNDELAQMSLIISNLANDENRKITLYQGGATVGMMNIGGQSIGTINIKDYMQKIGFKPLTNLSIADGKGTAYIAYKIIDYYSIKNSKSSSIKKGKEKLVLSIFIGGFQDESSYKDYVCDLDNIDERYDSVAKTIIDTIKNIKKNNSIVKSYIDNDDAYCYWITGKNIGGAVANKVASLLDNTDNIYSYTFACPNVLSDSTTGEYMKVIINEDDLLPKINDEDEGYHIDGAIYNKSVYWDLIPEYKEYIGNPNNYHGNYKVTNFIKNILFQVKNTFNNCDKNEYTEYYEYIKELYNETATFLYKMLSNYINETDPNFFLQTPINLESIYKFNDDLPLIREYKKEIADANSTKAYWCLVKSMDGYDLKGYYDGNYTKYQGTIEKPKSSNNESNFDNRKDLTVNVIQMFGEWYIKHIATYERNPSSSRATTEAMNYWNKYKDDKKRIERNNVGSRAVYRYIKNEQAIASKFTTSIEDFGYDTSEYRIKNAKLTGVSGSVDVNKYSNYFGDYCSEFAMSVIKNENNGKRGNDIDNPNAEENKDKNYGFGYLQHYTHPRMMHGPDEIIYNDDGSIKSYKEHRYENSGIATGSMNFYKAMIKLGYTRLEASSMSIDDLLPGDLLVSDNHVEYYFGYDYERDDESEEIISNKIVKKSKIDGQAFSTYGWGNVQNRFPFNDYYFDKKEEDCFRLRYSNGVSDGNKYTVVWRRED